MANKITKLLRTGVTDGYPQLCLRTCPQLIPLRSLQLLRVNASSSVNNNKGYGHSSLTQHSVSVGTAAAT